MDARFKFGLIEYDNSEAQTRIMDLIQKFEQYLELPLVDRYIKTLNCFLGDMSILEIDRKSSKLSEPMSSIDGAGIHTQ